MNLSVVLPAYNEGRNIVALCRRLHHTLGQLQIPHELIVIVQGDDGSYAALQQLQPQMPMLRAWHFPEPLGVARAFQEGFDRIAPEATHVLTMDADLNHQPEELPRFLETLERGCDIVIGSRYIAGGRIERMPAWKQALSRWMNHLFSALTPLRVADKTSGYRLQRRIVVEDVRHRVRAKNFDFYVEYLIHAMEAGYAMREVPITFLARVDGESKMRIPDTCYRYLRLILWTLCHRRNGRRRA